MSSIRALHQLSASLVARRTLCTAATAAPLRVAGMRVAPALKNVAFRSFASSARRFGEGSSAYCQLCESSIMCNGLFLWFSRSRRYALTEAEGGIGLREGYWWSVKRYSSIPEGLPSAKCLDG